MFQHEEDNVKVKGLTTSKSSLECFVWREEPVCLNTADDPMLEEAMDCLVIKNSEQSDLIPEIQEIEPILGVNIEAHVQLEIDSFDLSIAEHLGGSVSKVDRVLSGTVENYSSVLPEVMTGLQTPNPVEANKRADVELQSEIYKTLQFGEFMPSLQDGAGHIAMAEIMQEVAPAPCNVLPLTVPILKPLLLTPQAEKGGIEPVKYKNKGKENLESTKLGVLDSKR